MSYRVAFLVLLALGACADTRDAAEAPRPKPTYVGSAACRDCHTNEWEAWQTSHHWAAMQPATANFLGDPGQPFEHNGVVTEFSVESDRVVVTTDDEEGQLKTFPVPYTYGVEPLQQYLVEAGRGRLQALSVAWDSRSREQGGQRWFHLQGDEPIAPTDVMHWTKSSHNWNFMCADCHSTSVKKNYDVATRTYETQWAEVTVGCEACHGPGSDHVETAVSDPGSASYLRLSEPAVQENACAPCHSRRSQLREGFTPDQSYYDYYVPALLEPGLYHADGQILDEVYVYGSFLQSKMRNVGVKCSNCHEPHSGALKLAGNQVCTQCHNEAGRAEFATLERKVYDNPLHHFHEPGSEGAQCVSCHMPATTYMVVDPRRDHSFRIPRPDLTIATGAPNACAGCHEDESPEWAVAAIEARHGAAGEHYGTLFARGREYDPSAEADLAQLAGDAARPGIVRGTALAMLAGFSRRMSGIALEAGLRDADPLVRIGAVRGAMRWDPARRWRLLKRLLSDDVLAVRNEATRALIPISANLEGQDGERLAAAVDGYLADLQLQSDRAEGQTNVALVHFARNDFPAAEAALKEALALNSQWIPALANLADLYRETGRDDLAGPLLEEALALAPDNGDVLLALALWLVRQNRTPEAMPILENAWQSSRETRFAYLYAIALHGDGESRAALAVLEQALAIRPERQLIDVAISIARDAGLAEKHAEYVEMWR